MNQPPGKSTSSPRPPDWLRPKGVAPGTWDYVNERLIADHYDAFVADTPLCELDQQIIAQRFPAVPSNSQVVLDLGCGTGRNAIPLAMRGYHVVGIDLSRFMLQTMMAKAGEEPNISGRVDALQANLVELDCLATDSANHAICMFSTLGMIQGSENRKRFLTHVSRSLKPGGSLTIHVHHRWAALRESGGLRKLASSWWRSLRDKESEFGDATYAYRGLEKMFMHRFSHGELIHLLHETGWQIDQLHRVAIDGSSVTTGASIASGFIVIARR